MTRVKRGVHARKKRRATLELTTRLTVCAKRSSSASCPQSSIGIDTNTGPRGGSEAWWMARASASGTSSARGGSCAHFTYGWGASVASRLVRFASIVMCGRTC